MSVRTLAVLLAFAGTVAAAEAPGATAGPPATVQASPSQDASATSARRFEGFTALVAAPENSWTWDAAIFGALEERGFEVTFGGTLADLARLSRYDLVALSIKRRATPAEADALKKYVAQGGAVYGSWGGPMASPGFLQEVCRVGATRSVRLTQMSLLTSPLSAGISDTRVDFAPRAGHQAAGPGGWEVVTVEPLPGGIPVAADAAGHALGVLSRHGNGRTAVLGFGPEQDKFLARPPLGPAILDNLLDWLLEANLRHGGKAPPNRVEVALPARAEILGVFVDGQRLAEPQVRQVGSLKRIAVDVARVAAGKDVELRIACKPLRKTRNVETLVHLPWNTLRAAAGSPAALADYLKSLNATVCQPLLRGSFGEAWYKGMPEDKPDDKLVRQYPGNFLSDLIAECHKREIRLVAGIYFDNATPVALHPQVKRLDRQGREVKDSYGRACACFNHPLGQEHNLATLRQLLATYEADGIMLDDNFELDKNDCYCAYCKEGYKTYCEAKGIAWQDPATTSDETLAPRWRQYRREATQRLALEVRKIAGARGVPVGGWVEAGMDTLYLAGAFDLLGGMVYTSPPRSARGPLSVLGPCGYVCLLWAPQASPDAMEREVREAVHAGCATVGFWVRGDDGGYRMDPERADAIRRAFANVEKDWRLFYRNNLLSGDRRFAIVDGKLGAEDLRLRIRSTGETPRRRALGDVDLSALDP